MQDLIYQGHTKGLSQWPRPRGRPYLVEYSKVNLLGLEKLKHYYKKTKPPFGIPVPIDIINITYFSNR